MACNSWWFNNPAENPQHKSWSSFYSTVPQFLLLGSGDHRLDGHAAGLVLHGDLGTDCFVVGHHSVLLLVGSRIEANFENWRKSRGCSIEMNAKLAHVTQIPVNPLSKTRSSEERSGSPLKLVQLPHDAHPGLPIRNLVKHPMWLYIVEFTESVYNVMYSSWWIRFPFSELQINFQIHKSTSEKTQDRSHLVRMVFFSQALK